MRGVRHTTVGGIIDPQLPEGLVDELLTPLQAGIDVGTEERIRADIAEEAARPKLTRERERARRLVAIASDFRGAIAHLPARQQAALLRPHEEVVAKRRRAESNSLLLSLRVH